MQRHPQDLRAEKVETWTADEDLAAFRSAYHCSKCNAEAGKDDNYCRGCGKKFM